MSGIPAWAKVIGAVGFPAAIASVLIWFVIATVSADLKAIRDEIHQQNLRSEMQTETWQRHLSIEESDHQSMVKCLERADTRAARLACVQ